MAFRKNFHRNPIMLPKKEKLTAMRRFFSWRTLTPFQSIDNNVMRVYGMGDQRDE